MRINTITASHFMRYESFKLALPYNGIVLVTGRNGAGKSSIIEIVSMALWGQTLRGTRPWVSVNGPSVSVDVSVADKDESVLVFRGLKKKGTSAFLEWSIVGQADSFENTTKAQAALEHVIGTFDEWQCSSVFASRDADRFTSATDAERKRLLELLLGFSKFDEALECCRADLRVAQDKLTKMCQQLSNAQYMSRQQRTLVENAHNFILSTVADPVVIRAEFDEVVRDLVAAHNSTNAAESRRTGVRAEMHHREHEFKRERRAFTDLVLGSCSQCGQAYPHDKVAAAQERFEVLEREHIESVASLQKQYDTLCEAYAAEQERYYTLSRREGELASVLKQATADTAQQERAKGMLEQAVAALSALEAEVASLEAAIPIVRADVEELAVCERVLGLTGVRAHMLGRLLSGIEATANAWLFKIAGANLRLKLSPVTQRASGAVRQEISLEIEGAGGGHGYRAASSGERKRIDVALLFALGDIAAQVHGRTPGTLFIDEVDDGLDEDGIERMCTVFEELARTRCVVLITHNDALRARLPKQAVTAHYHVIDGECAPV